MYQLSTVALYQKSLFDFLNPFTDISGYFNLWDIFRFILYNLNRLNRKSASPLPPSPPHFKKSYPSTVLPPPFSIFQIPPSEGGNQTLLPLSKKSVCLLFFLGGEVLGISNYELAKKIPEQSFYCYLISH